MRILTVTHFFESHGGGIERVAGQLCREFAGLGATAVWAASNGDDPPRAGFEVVPLPCMNPTEKLTGLPMPIPGIGGYRALAREVRRSDAVVIHDALYATSILAMLLAKKRHKRIVLVQHVAAIPFSSPVLRQLMRMANRLVTGPMLRAADYRVFISDTVRQELLGEPARQSCELLFNGVDRAVFHAADGPAPVPDAVSTLDVGSRRILFVGRYVEKKGLSILRKLAEDRPDLTFFLVGSGPISPRAWRLANVHDLGARSQAELADLYRWADLLLLPSVGEGYPLVIQEAMACGLPVVCGEPTNRADPDAAPWICGVAVDLSDPAASAQRCASAIDSFDPSAADRAAMASYAVQRYDWPATARALFALATNQLGRPKERV